MHLMPLAVINMHCNFCCVTLLDSLLIHKTLEHLALTEPGRYDLAVHVYWDTKVDEIELCIAV
jgi:hypothetical protein